MKTIRQLKALVILTMLFMASVSAQVSNIDFKPRSFTPYHLPWDRLLQPAGLHILFGFDNTESHAMDVALSPDGAWLAVMERSSIVFINTYTNTVTFTLTNNSYGDLIGGMNTYSGIRWYKGVKGPEVYWPTTGKNGTCYIAQASWNGKSAKIEKLYEFKTIPPAHLSLPNEFLISRENDREYFYAVMNGCDRLIKMDKDRLDTAWIINPGVAPYAITMASGKIFVSNWAGRQPEKNDNDVAGTPWGSARVDNSKGGSTRESSVAIIDPASGKILKQVLTGLHSNKIISDSKGRFVYVANGSSDDITVIDARKEEITETISTRLLGVKNTFSGDTPNGLCLSADEKTLYVANGMDNALAVISLGKKSSLKSKNELSEITGFIPTGAYPSSVCISKSGFLYVANLEGAGVTNGMKDKNSERKIYNSHRMYASVSVIKAPGQSDLRAYTDTVIALNDLSRALASRKEPRKNIAPVPVPERTGEPSLFKHVLYIIKENRTYDQVLGDMKEGNGEASLCVYGEEITPNTHKLSREFLLLDNTHVSGKCSAEGHQWTDASIVTDYIEKNMKAWFRSYPHVQTDALVYSSTGFLWDNALKAGKKVRIYGEASVPEFPGPVTWSEIYHKFNSGDKIEFKNVTTIAPVKPILSETYPSYGSHQFPDIVRADAFIKELHEYEKMEGDQLPDLMIMALPNDHTAGTRPGCPTPRAMVADNDLALGQIIEAMSGSRFWKNTVVFVIEDDSQAGWDHVSAFRTLAMVISPYSRLNKTISTFYNQPSVIRTIEQILGLPPMNIQDAIASTLTDCFNDRINLEQYRCEKNRIPLDEMNKSLSQLSGKALHYARKSMLPEFNGIDSGDDDLMNRILWYSAKADLPYPASLSGKPGTDDDE